MIAAFGLQSARATLTDVHDSDRVKGVPMKLMKAAWSLLVGIKDGLVLIAMLGFFGFLYALLSSVPNPRGGEDGALLIALDGPVVEQSEAIDPRELLFGQSPVASQYQVSDILQALKAAERDDDIKVVVLDLQGFQGAGQVVLEDIAQGLDRIRAANKPVLAFAGGYFDDSYLLAAHASEIWLDPMGAAAFAGPGGSQLYFKGLMDRLGVNVHVYRVGKYKSFVEPFVRSEQSPEAKTENQALVDVLWANWKDNVTKARPKARIATIVADPVAGLPGAQGSLAQAALSAGLVDRLGDRVAFGKRVAAIAGGEDKGPAGNFRHTELGAYLAAHPAPHGGNKIGIVTVAGDIVDGSAPPGTAGGDTIADLITDALASQDLKALVVRIDSPGGSALAAERIRLALAEARAEGLPVVASMGNIAASGGYWVTGAADKVFAAPSTITGSIGVFGILPTFETTLAKYGVTADGVKTTPLSGQPDLFRGTNAAADAFLQAGVEDIYRRFIRLVSTARKMPIEKVEEAAQGRVWDGGTARQLGLVDAFGSLDDAVAEAARLAKLSPDSVSRVYLKQEESFIASLFEGGMEARTLARGDIFTQMARRQQALVFAGLADARTLLKGPAIQVRCLECPVALPLKAVPDTPDLTLFDRILSWLI